MRGNGVMRFRREIGRLNPDGANSPSIGHDGDRCAMGLRVTTQRAGSIRAVRAKAADGSGVPCWKGRWSLESKIGRLP